MPTITRNKKNVKKTGSVNPKPKNGTSDLETRERKQSLILKRSSNPEALHTDDNVLLELQDIVKIYGKKKVLKNISLKIWHGDRIGLIGANGGGKSTLSEIIAEVRKPTSGKVIFDKDKLRLGIQFQDSTYPNGISLRAMITYYIESFNVKISQEDLAKIIKQFRLEKFLKRNIQSLSGGQKQRLNILLSIVHNPNLIILDELSTGLDVQIRMELRTYIEKFLEDRDKSLILVSHSMGEVERLCNRLIVLSGGKIVKDSRMSDVIREYKSVENFAQNEFQKIYKELEALNAVVD